MQAVFGTQTASQNLAALPRSTRLGPAEGSWHVIDVNGEKLRVHRRFFRDIERADATAAVSAA